MAVQLPGGRKLAVVVAALDPGDESPGSYEQELGFHRGSEAASRWQII